MTWRTSGRRGACQDGVTHVRMMWRVSGRRGTRQDGVERVAMTWRVLQCRGACCRGASADVWSQGEGGLGWGKHEGGRGKGNRGLADGICRPPGKPNCLLNCLFVKLFVLHVLGVVACPSRHDVELAADGGSFTIIMRRTLNKLLICIVILSHFDLLTDNLF